MAYTKNPFIIDVEASGFGSTSYPIEVGVALSNGKRFCTLILPAPDWTHWDKEAEQIHHVSRDVLQSYGKPVTEVADQLNDMFEGKILYSDGWVVDKPWLTTLFHAAGREMKFHVSPLEMILNEQQMEIWHETKNEVINQVNLKRHRASNDAVIIQETFKQTLELTFEEHTKQSG